MPSSVKLCLITIKIKIITITITTIRITTTMIFEYILGDDHTRIAIVRKFKSKR